MKQRDAIIKTLGQADNLINAVKAEDTAEGVKATMAVAQALNARALVIAVCELTDELRRLHATYKTTTNTRTEDTQ